MESDSVHVRMNLPKENGDNSTHNCSSQNGNSEKFNKSESESLLDGQREEDFVDALPKSLRYSNFDIFCTLLSIGTYLLDLAMDIVVAVYFYHLAISHGIYHRKVL